ncbi:hypothetical protein D9M72_482530 [compost metagenome]
MRAIERGTRDRRQIGELGAPRCDIRNVGEEGVLRPIDDRVVEGIVDVENLDRDLRLARSVAEGRDLVGRSRDRHGIVGIDRCDAEVVETARLGKGAGGVFSEHDGRHRAVAGKQVLMQRALRHDRNGVDQ